MLLRKSRKHLQGASNRHAAEGSFYNTFYKPLSAAKHEILKKHNLTCSTSHLKTRPRPAPPLRNSTEADPQLTRGQNRLEQQLRKVYQGRRNIVKAIDGWGFDARGFISSSAFEEKVREKLGVEPEDGEVEELLQRYCGSSQRVNAQELIALIHGATEGSLFNERLFSPEQASLQREAKIENLKESVRAYEGGGKAEMDYSTIDRFLFKVNSAISKMKDLSDGKLTGNKTAFFSQLASLADYGHFEQQALRRIEDVVDYDQLRYNIQSHSSVDHLFLDPILRKTHVVTSKPQKQQSQ
jgi:hypothetical protein